MKYLNLVFAGILLGGTVAPLGASASQFMLPSDIGRIEGPRDLNLLQVEPTIIHEGYYTSGRCERQQFIGNVLPAGAEIPDSDPAPVKATVKVTPANVVAPSVVPTGQPSK